MPLDAFAAMQPPRPRADFLFSRPLDATAPMHETPALALQKFPSEGPDDFTYLDDDIGDFSGPPLATGVPAWRSDFSRQITGYSSWLRYAYFGHACRPRCAIHLMGPISADMLLRASRPASPPHRNYSPRPRLRVVDIHTIFTTRRLLLRITRKMIDAMSCAGCLR